MVRIWSTAVGCGTSAAGRGGTAGVRYRSRGLWCAAGRRCHRPRLWWHGQPAVLLCAGVVAQAGEGLPVAHVADSEGLVVVMVATEALVPLQA
jgi:hypothetical protein